MKAAILAVSLLTSFSFCSVASAQLTKLTIGSNTLSGSGLPAWIAKDAGIFRKNGLDVQIVYFRGGTITAMALVARETPIGQVTGPPIVSAGLKGADAVMIAGGNVVSEYWLMSRPEIKTAAQLKGGSVAIANFGGQADFLSRIALQRLGLNPLKDVTIVQIGTIPERLSALATGKVQAAMLNSPDNFRAEKGGYYNLVSVRLPYLRALTEGLQLVRENAGLLERSYDDASTDDKLPQKQYPSLEGIRKILEPLAETDPKAKAAKPEDFVDMRFIKELDESGFIDDLYKSRKR